MVQNRRQANTWTNGDKDQWHLIYFISLHLLITTQRIDRDQMTGFLQATFQIHLIQWKSLNFDYIFSDVCY